jgi:hypothetical protein
MTTATMVGLTPDLFGYSRCNVCGDLRKALVDGRCETPCEARSVENEREACARLIEARTTDSVGSHVDALLRDLAASIRARGHE